MRAGIGLQLRQQAVHGLPRQDDGQHAVLETVVAEDIAEGGRDRHPEPVIVERPHGIFTRRPAAEIVLPTTTRASRYGGWFNKKSGFSVPSASKRRSRNRHSASPNSRGAAEVTGGYDLVGVDILPGTGKATASMPVNWVLMLPGCGNRQTADNGCRRSHGRAHQMGACAGPLPALKIAVGSGGTALTRRHDVAIRAQAHGTSGLPPFEPGIHQDTVPTPPPPPGA